MANILGPLNPIFYANEALVWLRNALGMAQRVHMGFDMERRSFMRGQTISIRRPDTFVAQKGAITTQDIEVPTIDIVLDQRPEVRVEITDVELAYTGERLITDHIGPMANALADQIDQDLAALYTDIPYLYDYGAATDHTVVTGTNEVGFNNQVPMNDGMLHMMIDGTLQMGFQNADFFQRFDATGQGANMTLFNGTLGTRFGVEIFANQNTPTHVPGTANQTAGDSVGAVNVAGGLLKNATSVVVDGFTGSETIAKGDTFTIAGNATRYAVTADLTLSTGAGTINFTPPAVQAYADDSVVTFTKQPDAGSTQQLYFHRNAFAWASAPLPSNLPGIDVGVATDPQTGMSVRASRWADGENKKTFISLDTLYGVKTLDPRLAVRAYT